MGVTDLWKILAPAQSHVPLADLRGQTLAVDLSIWIVEAEGVAQMKGRVVRPYLRNLFFRISHLQQLGIRLVFVIEGEAPELKLETMARRQQARGGRGGRGGPPNRAGKGQRSRFKAWLNECCHLLDSLGIAYVQSKGEAEALCALLTLHGMVDGCITNDGDAFLYGATTVYRNFSTSNKDVEVYHASTIEHTVGLCRDRLVALALLLGCDFCPGGVPGVGSTIAMKLMHEMSQQTNVLKRFKEWSSRPCMDIGPVEMQVRRKAVGLGSQFPNTKVITEFMAPKDNLTYLQLNWSRPKMFHFQKFMVEKVEWVEEYALSKVLPLVTLYDMSAIQARRREKKCLLPHSIVKPRVRQGVPVYEVQWNKVSGDTITEAEFYVTLEEKVLFDQCFPEVVIEFEEASNAKKKGKPSRRKKKADTTDEVQPVSRSMSDSDEELTSAFNSLALKDRIGLSNVRDKSEDVSCPSLSQPVPSKVSKVILIDSDLSDLERDLDNLKLKSKAAKKLKKKSKGRAPEGLLTFSDDETLLANTTDIRKQICVKKKNSKASTIRKKVNDKENIHPTRKTSSKLSETEGVPKTVLDSDKVRGLEAVADAVYDDKVEIKFSSEDFDMMPLSQRLLLRASQVGSDIETKAESLVSPTVDTTIISGNFPMEDNVFTPTCTKERTNGSSKFRQKTDSTFSSSIQRADSAITGRFTDSVTTPRFGDSILYFTDTNSTPNFSSIRTPDATPTFQSSCLQSGCDSLVNTAARSGSSINEVHVPHQMKSLNLKDVGDVSTLSGNDSYDFTLVTGGRESFGCNTRHFAAISDQTTVMHVPEAERTLSDEKTYAFENDQDETCERTMQFSELTIDGKLGFGHNDVTVVHDFKTPENNSTVSYPDETVILSIGEQDTLMYGNKKGSVNDMDTVLITNENANDQTVELSLAGNLSEDSVILSLVGDLSEESVKAQKWTQLEDTTVIHDRTNDITVVDVDNKMRNCIEKHSETLDFDATTLMQNKTFDLTVGSLDDTDRTELLTIGDKSTTSFKPSDIIPKLDETTFVLQGIDATCVQDQKSHIEDCDRTAILSLHSVNEIKDDKTLHLTHLDDVTVLFDTDETLKIDPAQSNSVEMGTTRETAIRLRSYSDTDETLKIDKAQSNSVEMGTTRETAIRLRSYSDTDETLKIDQCQSNSVEMGTTRETAIRLHSYSDTDETLKIDHSQSNSVEIGTTRETAIRLRSYSDTDETLKIDQSRSNSIELGTTRETAIRLRSYSDTDEDNTVLLDDTCLEKRSCKDIIDVSDSSTVVGDGSLDLFDSPSTQTPPQQRTWNESQVGDFAIESSFLTNSIAEDSPDHH